ncbi:hypothetical protein TrVFT333_009382 [Trichoderma virens FT-333]|nr:hypothetical protein TrVFT333_009382 [Trichoderma virens FT-333]
MSTSRMLEEGNARIDEALQKGYAPSHFAHNLELIMVEDNRSSASLSMRSKIASTRERAAALRTLNPLTLVWWAIAFPMRQWSGGRKMSTFAFDSLLRMVCSETIFAYELLPIVRDDLYGLRLKYPLCEVLQNFLNSPIFCPTYLPSPISDNTMLLEDEPVCNPTQTIMHDTMHSVVPGSPVLGFSNPDEYIQLTGVRQNSLDKLPDLLRSGLKESRRFQMDRHNQSTICTAIDIFVPTDPVNQDAYAVIPIGSTDVWNILQELGIVE